MTRTLSWLPVAALAVLAACDSPTEIDPGGGGQTPSACPASPSQVSGTGNLSVLGLGCVARRHTSELWVHDGWGYTATWGNRSGNPGNTLYVWNVSGNEPVLRDSIRVSEATTLGDVQVSEDGRVLVVATEGGAGSIVIYDRADPAKPREIARHSTTSTRSGVHTAELAVVNGRLHAFLSVTGQRAVVIVDLSDPAAPREVASITAGSSFTHDVFVRDGLLFTASWDDGAVIWDIGGGGRGGSLEKPVEISRILTRGGKVHNLWWYRDPSGARSYLLVGEEGPGSVTSGSSSGDIHVVDLSDLSRPKEVAFYTLAGAGTHNFSVDEPSGILYAAYYNGGVRALDVRGDLGACTAAQKDASGRCDLGKMGREVGRALVSSSQAPTHVWGVQLVGNRLYASDMLNGLWKLDVSALKR